MPSEADDGVGGRCSGRKNGKEDGGKRMVEGIVKNMMMVGKERGWCAALERVRFRWTGRNVPGRMPGRVVVVECCRCWVTQGREHHLVLQISHLLFRFLFSKMNSANSPAVFRK